MDQTNIVRESYELWEQTVREFVARAEAIQALGAVEVSKGLLLYGIRLYEDILKSSLPTHDRIACLVELNHRSHTVLSYAARHRAGPCDLTRYNFGEPIND